MKSVYNWSACGLVLHVLFIAICAVIPLELPATETEFKDLVRGVCETFMFNNESMLRTCQENLSSDSIMEKEEITKRSIEVKCQRNTSTTIKFRPAAEDGWEQRLLVLFLRGNDSDFILTEFVLLNSDVDFHKISTFNSANYSMWSTLLNSDGYHSQWLRGPDFTALSTNLEQKLDKYEVNSTILYNIKKDNSTVNASFVWYPIDGEDTCYDVTNSCFDKTMVSHQQTILLEPHQPPLVEEIDLPLATDCTFKVQGQRGLTEYKYRTLNPIIPLQHVDNVSLHSESSSSGQGWDVIVSWVVPRHLPQHYNVTVFPDKGDKHSIIVPRNATMAAFKNVMAEESYYMKIASVVEDNENATVKRAFFNNWPPEDSTATTMAAATATASLLVCVGVALAAMYWYRRRADKDRHFYLGSALDKLSKEEWLENSRSCGGDWSNSSGTEAGDQWEVAGERVTLHEVIGEGAFGLVRRGTIAPASKDVAVKMLKEFPSVEEIRSFRAEMELMKGVGRHAHVVGLVGCCSGRRPLILVEYCAKGDLLTYLRRSWDVMISKRNAKYYNNNSESMDYRDDVFKSKQDNPKMAINKLYNINGVCDPDLSFVDLLSFCRQIALGMEFLASNRVVHRDLAARNILVTEDKTLKIADFGLSRDVYQENQYKQKGNGKMPVKWMALESLTLKIYTTQSDVWSFGVVMWEVVTVGGSPYAGVSPTRLLRLLRAGYRLPRPGNCTPQLYDVMCSCWAARAHARPTFSALVAQLDAMLHAVSAHRYLALDLDPTDRDLATSHTRSHREKYLPIIYNVKRAFGLGVSYERPRDTALCNHYTSSPYALPAHTKNDYST